MTHREDCNWIKSDCEWKRTHHYCPHEEHRCNCRELNYRGDDNHLLEHEDGHIRIDCWCEPELVHDTKENDHYILHKDINGNTLLSDPAKAN